MKKGALSLAEWCERENKPQLLALYDRAANPLPPSEVSYSSGLKYQFRCPVCGIGWKESCNKLNRRKKGSYNQIMQRNEETFCPYCKGERPSPQYNLAVAVPEIEAWWDKERNPRPPQEYLPGTHQKVYLRCWKCKYAFPHPVRISDRSGILRCPCCGDGKNREATVSTCLEACFPEISGELDDGRNGGITGQMVLPSYSGKLWFICSAGHRYRARVSNRTYLNRGCPICREQEKTSFPEQAFRFYLQKCAPDLQSCQNDPYTGRNVDILIPSHKTAIEFNSLYFHGSQRGKADLDKVRALTQYYRVYIITEKGWEPFSNFHPLLEIIPAPVFRLTCKLCSEYDRLIYELLRTLFPDRESYPNIDIMRDQLLILQQYIKTKVDRNFEEEHPLLAADWASEKNGTLTPSMFRSNSPYKFFWTCRSCKKVYQMSMANRLKVNPDTCPYCCRKSRYSRPMLIEEYPFLKAFWNKELNCVPLAQVAVASEKLSIFELLDGRVVPVRICNLSAWLKEHQDHNVEQYLEQQWKKLLDMASAHIHTSFPDDSTSNPSKSGQTHSST